MVKRIKKIKNALNPGPDYAEIYDLLENEDVSDEEIARYMNLDIETVRSIKKELQDDEINDAPSTFFKTWKPKKDRRKT
ncbi:hypothetical protein [Thermoanaerobacterium sp. DL9XJH110]|uniref:hypothetical protein n=1 Tax=Thermoanaerobacterium sp. DL9XJH110 TaxID=3386643 RepID=UPI003BB5B127